MLTTGPAGSPDPGITSQRLLCPTAGTRLRLRAKPSGSPQCARTESLLNEPSEISRQNDEIERQNNALYASLLSSHASLLSSLKTNHSSRRYVAVYPNGRRMELEAISREAALLAARELFGPGLVRVVEGGQW